MHSCYTSGQNSRSSWLNCHNFNCWIFGFKIFAYSSYCTTCAYACNKNINFSISIFIYFWTCRNIVCHRISRIYKLTWYKTIRYFTCKFFSLSYCTFHPFCTLCKYKLSAIRFHYLSTFNGHCLRHNNDYFISSCSSNGCKSYASVT